MKRKDFWKGFGVALALIVVLNLAWKPICRAIPWHVLPFEISMSKDAKVDMIQSYLDKYYVEDIDQGKLEDTLFAGMLAGVGDKYTYYMPIICRRKTCGNILPTPTGTLTAWGLKFILRRTARLSSAA